jgi:hypothetical protein
MLGLGILKTAISTTGKIASDLIGTKESKEQNSFEVKKLEHELAVGQIDINKIEAASESKFKSWWRPALGWVCVLAFTYSGLLEPFLRFISVVLFHYNGDFPVVNTDIMTTVLYGMLGLGTMRSVDKKMKTNIKK